MSGDTSSDRPARPTDKNAARDARLRSALRANLARRKAQARVRNDGGGASLEGPDLDEDTRSGGEPMAAQPPQPPKD